MAANMACDCGMGQRCSRCSVTSRKKVERASQPMAAKEPTVERRHHELANDLLASLTWTDGDVDQDLAAKALANAEAAGLANRDERCLQRDMQRIRERVAAKRAWDEGYAGYLSGATNPYRLPAKGDGNGG